MIKHIKNKFIYYGSLIIVLFLFCLLSLISLPAYSQIPPEEEEAEKSDSIRRSDVEYTAVNFQDPFMPQLDILKEEEEPQIIEEVVSDKPKASELFSFSIQGIIWNSDIPLVIINNQVLKKGEIFLMDNAEEIKIIDIDKEGVTIMYSGREEKLFSPNALELQK